MSSRSAPITLGLVGLPCSGKSAVTKVLASLGVKVFDVDAVGHSMLERPGVIRALVAEFGKAILTKDRQISRKKLATLVFANSERLKFLEALVHPYISGAVTAGLKHFPEKSLVMDAALLFPLGLHAICDFIWLVKSPRDLRRRRARARGWTHVQLAAREPRIRKSIKQHPFFITHELSNTGTLPQLRQQVRILWQHCVKVRTLELAEEGSRS